MASGKGTALIERQAEQTLDDRAEKVADIAEIFEHPTPAAQRYVRALMRADVERTAQGRLEAKLLRAMKRADMKEATPEFWEKLRSEVLGNG